NMSHELRTPLNSILGFSELLAQQDFALRHPEKCQDYAQMINQAGNLLLDLINDVLDLSKIEAGQVRLQEVPVDLREVLEHSLSLVRPRAENMEVALRLELPETFPRLLADRRYLQQILLNLLSNAVKFTPEGGEVKISAETDPQGACRIAISDSGIGIAAEDIDNVLQPFGQVAESYRRGHEGTGLGLPICTSLMALHGGDLEMTSTPKQGTTVVIAFPPERTHAC
ncbi:MAG: ATP-binding protein, partial [Rhodovibrionaceae bacterium]